MARGESSFVRSMLSSLRSRVPVSAVPRSIRDKSLRMGLLSASFTRALSFRRLRERLAG